MPGNLGKWTESDFYTYRYLANEGFMPGYNFPRLPVRTLISAADKAQAIDRPRFLGLSEFGPGNTINVRALLPALHCTHRKADTEMAKGQEKKATTNKPKLTVKEKKAKKKAKAAK